MPTEFRCSFCNKVKQGRFTRRKGGTARNWSGLNNAQSLYWACWECLPMGQGRGESIEESEMPAKKTVAPIVPPPVTGPSAALVAKAKKEGLALIPPLADEVNGLEIQSDEDYQRMDGLLSDVILARKTWTAKLAPVRDPLKEAVKASKAALKAADALFDEVDTPLEEVETEARKRMKDYQNEKLRLVREAAEKQRQLQAEIDRQAQIEAYGRTSASRQKATAVREQLEEQQAEVFEAAPTLAQAENSGQRVAQKVRVKDGAKFLRFVADNYEELQQFVEVLQPALNRQLKEDVEGLKSWPGIEIYDDVTIVKR